ncbi:MAG: serine/threonine protein kinase [Comamonadaceae bacterium]|nr:MAG: serine/threonine protein kinase [Comamonadaceae bacterium]
MSLKKLGRYDLIRVLGKGAMGLVYEGRDPNLDRRVAIKTIKVENLSDEAAADYEIRFRTEARSAARLQHPNIVSVYDSDRDIDIAYLVMEFIQGDDLKHHLDSGVLYTLEQTLGIMTDLLSALDYAHRQAIVHRDIKPANLLIEADGRVKLTDFGVARIQDSGDLTRTQGSIVGTLKYMSPEQVQGRPVDARADLFAAGIVLYQLLTGRRPFDGGSDFATIQQIVNHTPEAPTFFNDRLPPALDTVIAKALAKSRDQRYSTAQEFSKALKDAARDATDPSIVPTMRGPAYGPNATWTGTVHAGEALSGLQSSVMGGGAASTVTQELELVYWKDIKDSVDAEDLQLFINKFPTGIYADLARRRLKKLGVLASEESDSGLRTGTLTQIFVQGEGGQAADKTILTPREASGQGATSSDSTRTTVLPPGAAAAPAMPAPVVSAPATIEASNRAPSTSTSTSTEQTVALATGVGALPVTAAPVPQPARVDLSDSNKTAEPALSAEAPPRDSQPFVDMPGPPAVAGSPVPPPAVAASKPASRRVTWALAGLAVLVAAVVGVRMMSSTPSAAVAAPAIGQGAAGVPMLAGSAPLAASSTPVAVPETPASTPVAVRAAASAASAAAIAPLSAASARKARAEKAAADKAARAEAAAASGNTPADKAERPHSAASAAAAGRSAGDSRGGNPEAACEGRMLFGFQMCLAQECAKPSFANHPVCVKRRVQEQQRRDEEMLRR